MQNMQICSVSLEISMINAKHADLHGERDLYPRAIIDPTHNDVI